jgi:hypothetical protein
MESTSSPDSLTVNFIVSFIYRLTKKKDPLSEKQLSGELEKMKIFEM